MEVIKNDGLIKVFYDAISRKLAFESWSLNCNQINKTQFRMVAARPKYNEIKLVPFSKEFIPIESIVNGAGEIYLYSDDESTLYCMDIKKVTKDGEFVLSFPKIIEKYERRRDPRFVLSFRVDINIKDIKLERIKKCYDLSLHGMSIIFSKTEKVNFEEGDILENISIGYKGTKIRVQAKVVKVLFLSPYQLDDVPYGGKRISLKFIGLGKKQKMIIEKILEDHKKISSRAS